MDLKTVHSIYGPPELRNAILRESLLSRRAELSEYWKRLTSRTDLESLGPLGRQVESFLSEHDPIPDFALPFTFKWLAGDKDFVDCLVAVALAKKVECCPAEVNAPPLSIGSLKKLSAAERFEALRVRYRCPLNIGRASELEIAEELLRQLMVNDRAKIEQGGDIEVNLVLLALNLIGVRALVTRDLRSLDALNYFYELPQRSWVRMRADFRLLACWLCIYRQLLSVPDWLRCA